ncbi:MAG: VWA domain-containing protein [Candidatus Sungbacteria bacterium]|nr:VWA domain-containing protein [bacterium]MDZ4260240.1 VWA domain-containing protein [Candidatus Sungbacteria bacterium]
MRIFANPWILAVLPLIPIAVIMWIRAQKKRAYLYSDERLLAPLRRSVKIVSAAAHASLIVSLVLGVLAFARPLGEIVETRTHEYMHVGCLVVDISGSMSGSDNENSTASKISVVIAAAQEFVSKRKGDAFCEIPFSSSVELAWAMPVTNDINAINDALEELVKHVDGNTAMGDGMFYAFVMLLADLLEANDRLDIPRLLKEVVEAKTSTQVPENSYLASLLRRVGVFEDTYITVLTDAEYNWGQVDPPTLLEILQRFGIRVYILGVGFEYTSFPDLLRLVRSTGGDIFLARNSGDTARLLEEVNKLQKRKVLSEIVKKPKELSPLFMFFSLVCAVIFFVLWTALRVGYAVKRYMSRLYMHILHVGRGGERRAKK